MRKIIFLYLCIAALAMANENGYKLEEIEELYSKKIITKEDYDILKSEIQGKNEDMLYNLIISNATVDTKFPVVMKEGVNYIELKRFFKDIELTNFSEKKGIFDIKLGKELKPVYIDFTTLQVRNNNEQVEVNAKDFLVEGNNYFLNEELFKKLFLSYLEINKKDLTVRMGLSFPTPQRIKQILEVEKQNLERKKDDEILYKSQRKLFDIGYARVSLAQHFSKTKNEGKKRDWNGNIEYQGAALYGEVTANYDLKNRDLNTIKLNYDQFIKNHRFIIENHTAYKDDNSKTREWGFFLYKDKGYFNYGENVVIREDVPIGSRAELIYLGTVVDIKDAENGVVEFSGELVKNDREYELKIYTPDNKIITKTIKTTQDYNRQSKSEIAYNMSWYQNVRQGGRYNGNFNMFYGVTNQFTVGAGVSRNIINYVDKNKVKHTGYKHNGNIELVYGGVKNGLGYTLSTKYSKGFDNDNPSVKESEDYSLNNMIDLTYDKYKLNIRQDNFGKEYHTKQVNYYNFKYDIFKNLRIGYYYTTSKVRKGKDFTNSGLNLSADYTYKNILFSGSGDIDLKDNNKNRYSIGAYYGAAQNYNMRFTNTWSDNGKRYSSTIGLYNNNFGGVMDMALEGTYDSKNKGYATIRFNVKLMDLLTLDFNSDNKGNNRFAIGIDKVVDLKNPTVNMRNMNASRLNIKTFIDANDNNLLDKGEIGLSGVEIEIGENKVETDKYGNAMIYGITNNIKQNLKVTIKKPHYKLENENIKIFGTTSSTIDVFIPIKPMIDIAGYVDLASDLGLSPSEASEFYGDILIQIKDKNGETLEYVAPDNIGRFDVSGLFPEEYIIEVSYLGDKYVLPKLERKLKLSYDSSSEDRFNYEMALEVTKDEIKMYTRN